MVLQGKRAQGGNFASDSTSRTKYAASDQLLLRARLILGASLVDAHGANAKALPRVAVIRKQAARVTVGGTAVVILPRAAAHDESRTGSFTHRIHARTMLVKVHVEVVLTPLDDVAVHVP